jgi:glucosyl-dolichyl phosphate glucuronosyltransferase
VNRPTPPLLELVICTYNNASMLDFALSSLARQEPPTQADWACLVVDNNCTDATADVVAGHLRAGRIPALRLVHEPVQGLTPARLRGVVSTTAPWIGFIDDDCLLRDDWVRNGIHFALEHPTAGGFGGRVALDWERPPRGYVKRHGWCFAEQDHGPAERVVPALAGAGLVLRRAAIEESGWVDEPLLADRVGHELTSGGDVEMSLRVAGSGYELWYTPACELRHRIPERRTSFAYVAAMTRALGASQAYADALVWEGSVASWLATSVGRLCRAALVSSAMIPAAMRSRTRAADLAISWSFLFGRTRGYYRVARMDRDRRQALIGGARPTRRLRRPLLREASDGGVRRPG